MAIIEQMIELKIKPTTASYNVILEAMFESKDIIGVEKLVTRMEKAKESMLDDESYTLIVGLFLAVEEIDGAFIHIYIAMNSGCMVSMPVFTECVICAIRLRRFGLLTTILEEYMVVIDLLNFAIEKRLVDLGLGFYTLKDLEKLEP
ncbi:hypothetical protein MKW92_053040 [Papaver armeniacum]|nr:hypothetical protein MKW92_053040 [Papaver armeniacum]